jgi:hypothetical protein
MPHDLIYLLGYAFSVAIAGALLGILVAYSMGG